MMKVKLNPIVVFFKHALEDFKYILKDWKELSLSLLIVILCSKIDYNLAPLNKERSDIVQPILSITLFLIYCYIIKNKKAVQKFMIKFRKLILFIGKIVVFSIIISISTILAKAVCFFCLQVCQRS